ncbi:unnamed protein product, partial [Hydatigera taeniaeformis]|uniref:Secreted protein n=1 Tax=Hydatigena taeniaeformis TaxID=6205 RepID=A0A0R3WWP0_HYDTA
SFHLLSYFKHSLFFLAGDDRPRVSSVLNHEPGVPSNDVGSLAIVGKPVAKVCPHVQRNSGKVERSYLVQDYLERRLAAAKNRAKSDNRSYGVACALGHSPVCKCLSF